MTVELIESPPEAYLAGYATIHEVPADVLAHRVVGQMILAKGNLNKYKAILTLLIQDLRSAAPEPIFDDPRSQRDAAPDAEKGREG